MTTYANDDLRVASGRAARSGLQAAAMCILLSGTGMTALAEPGALVTAYAIRGHSLALDPVRPRVYVSLEQSNSVAVIDTDTLALTDTVAVGSSPRGIAVSPDGSSIYVANSGSTFVSVLDAETLSSLQSLAVATNPSDVEIGVNNRLYLTPANRTVSGIMTVDAQSGADLGIFSNGVFVYQNSLLEISPDGRTLYMGNRGISPGTVAKFDVSVSPPTLLYKNPHGSLGSNGQDLVLTADGQFLSYPAGGGNGPGYTIYKLDTANFAVVGEFDTAAYPRELAYSPDGTTAYAVNTSGEIKVFDATTFLLESTIATDGEARELVVSQDGAYLFAVFDDELRVYETGSTQVALPCEVDVDADSYEDGDVIALTTSIANPGATVDTVEWKVWLELPQNDVSSLINFGADGSLALPPGFSFAFGPFPLVTVDATVPRGSGEVGCRLLDPNTGATKFVNTSQFTID